MSSSPGSSSKVLPSSINSRSAGDTGSASTMPANISKTASVSQPSQDPDEEEGDEEHMDLSVLQSFADKVQRQPMEDGSEEDMSIPRVIIPKRGEKDFEPLAETVNLQEMMLQRSREALFGALVGVRGGNSKSMAHALLTDSSAYPRVLIARGHLLDGLGISVRYPAGPTGKPKTYTELLPEEALYLLERGSLQIWTGKAAKTLQEVADGLGEWCEEEYGVKGAVELSVMEGFATFIGQDGLSWERYQAYAYLKRLGYTVQRTRRFLPSHFTSSTNVSGRASTGRQASSLPPFNTWWSNIPTWIAHALASLRFGFLGAARSVISVGLSISPARVVRRLRRSPLLGHIQDLDGTNYESVFRQLRFVPASHKQLVPMTPAAPIESVYDLLHSNPYLPFWHVWKPATPWSKINWDRGSDAGLMNQKPEYIVAVINARDVRLPSLAQLSEVFEELPDEPKGPVKKLGPQYERKPANKRAPADKPPSTGLWNRLMTLFRLAQPSKPHAPGNPMGMLRNGDRALIVAVNDSGNTGWVRFGRTGFSEHVVI